MSGTHRLTVDLSRLPSESHQAHVDRIAHLHTLPGKVARHQDTTTEPTAAAELTPKELAELQRASEAKGAEAMKLLQPKKRRK